MRIQTARPSDFEQTARLHRAYLKMGLFPKLGRSFLKRYQATFLYSPHGIALVAKSEEGEVLGAVFGTASNADHYRWVVRNCGTQLAMAGCRAMLTRPALAWTFASTRLGRYARSISRHAAPSMDVTPREIPTGPVAVLSHIVTADEARRQGIGRRLVEVFKRQARREGAHRAVLVTEEGGQGAPFFEQIGCQHLARRTGQDGRTIHEYAMALEEARNDEITVAYRRNRRVFTGTYRPDFPPIPAPGSTRSIGAR